MLGVAFMSPIPVRLDTDVDKCLQVWADDLDQRLSRLGGNRDNANLRNLHDLDKVGKGTTPLLTVRRAMATLDYVQWVVALIEYRQTENRALKARSVRLITGLPCDTSHFTRVKIQFICFLQGFLFERDL